MKILREEANHIGYKKKLLHPRLYRQRENHWRTFWAVQEKKPLFKAQHQISLWKNDLKTPEVAVQTASNVWEQQTARVYASYQETPTKLSGGGLRRLNLPARRAVAAKQRSAQQMAAAVALSAG